MALGDRFVEDIDTSQGRLQVAPLAVEPVYDVAVLGALDDQECSKEVADFERFCESTKPVPVCREDVGLFESFFVYVYTHNGTWVTGSATKYTEDAPTLFVEADAQIEGGTSAGPILNTRGELVGIVSAFNIPDTQVRCSGRNPRPHLTLPVWVCRRIFSEKSEL